MKYHAKWQDDDDIEKSLYECQSYWAKPKRKVDTVYVNRRDEPVEGEGEEDVDEEVDPTALPSPEHEGEKTHHEKHQEPAKASEASGEKNI